MEDPSTTVQELKQRVLAFADERDWQQFHTPKNLAMALSAETGELMEHFLWMDSEASRRFVHDPHKREAILDEIADIVIYAMEFANSAGVDLATAIDRKMAKNAQKYPVEKARGRSVKYTEL
jgi:NTP pyrophosphatase (non-canonical NTP hydrolase)